MSTSSPHSPPPPPKTKPTTPEIEVWNSSKPPLTPFTTVLLLLIITFPLIHIAFDKITDGHPEFYMDRFKIQGVLSNPMCLTSLFVITTIINVLYNNFIPLLYAIPSINALIMKRLSVIYKDETARGHKFKKVKKSSFKFLYHVCVTIFGYYLITLPIDNVNSLINNPELQFTIIDKFTVAEGVYFSIQVAYNLNGFFVMLNEILMYVYTNNTTKSKPKSKPKHNAHELPADYKEMLLHHSLTLMLLYLSLYKYRFLSRSALIVLWTHDCSDWYIDGCKVLNFFKVRSFFSDVIDGDDGGNGEDGKNECESKGKLTNPFKPTPKLNTIIKTLKQINPTVLAYILMLSAWIYYRLYLFPTMVIVPAYNYDTFGVYRYYNTHADTCTIAIAITSCTENCQEYITKNEHFLAKTTVLTLLSLLYTLHLYWLTLFIRVGVRLVCSGGEMHDFSEEGQGEVLYEAADGYGKSGVKRKESEDGGRDRVIKIAKHVDDDDEDDDDVIENEINIDIGVVRVNKQTGQTEISF